jgi:hypothetical protein
MSSAFPGFEKQRLARCRLLAELRYRRLPRMGGWSHCGAQFGTEPTSLALLALDSFARLNYDERELEAFACQRPNGLAGCCDRRPGANIWATALAINTLMVLGLLLRCSPRHSTLWFRSRPLEASWLVRLKFRISDRVRFDPTKYGWPWVRMAVSWVVPTSASLSERARRKD